MTDTMSLDEAREKLRSLEQAFKQMSENLYTLKTEANKLRKICDKAVIPSALSENEAAGGGGVAGGVIGMFLGGPLGAIIGAAIGAGFSGSHIQEVEKNNKHWALLSKDVNDLYSKIDVQLEQRNNIEKPIVDSYELPSHSESCTSNQRIKDIHNTVAQQRIKDAKEWDWD